MRRAAPGAALLFLLGLAFVLPAAPACALEPAAEVARAVAGVAGDPLVGGCKEFLPRGNGLCHPQDSERHAAPECAGTECDRFLDIAFAPGTVSVRAQLIDPPPTHAIMETVAWQRRR